MKEDNQAVIKALNIYGRVPEKWELLEEIERLNNIRNKAIDFLKKNACIDEDVRYFCDDLRYDDCNILLDILEGSDKE